MKVRKFEISDYPLLQSWFKDWGWDSWPIELLSPYSYLVEKDGIPILYTSFYKYEGCSGGSMGFTISDQNCSKFLVGKAISLGLDHVFTEAKKLGLTAMQYATDQESKVMVDFFVKKGGQITDSGNAYIAIIGFDQNTDFFYEGKKNG